MREIKFRARWRDTLKEVIDFNDEYTIAACEDDAFIVEQYTGLKDKKGVHIYEGDILEVPDDYEVYGFMAGEIREIYFKDGCFRLKPKEGRLGRGHTLDDCIDELEIIGNIHEHSKLLK